MERGDFRRARERHRRWKRLAAAFLRPAAPPTPAETEAFVARVMGRVEAERAVPAWAGLLRPRWLVPAFGAALAAVVLAVRAPEPEAPLDVLLLLDEPSVAAVDPLLAANADPASALLLGEEP